MEFTGFTAHSTFFLKPAAACLMAVIALFPYARHVVAQEDAQFDMKVEDWGEISPEKAKMLVSPDRQHFAFASNQGSRQIVVVDGKASPGFAEIRKESLKFTSDSSKLVFVGRNGSSDHVVVSANGKFFVSEAYRSVLDVQVSPVGNRIAWAIGDNEYVARQIVVDGKLGKRFEEIFKETFCFSPDGTHFAYVVQSNKTEYRVVMDGSESPVMQGRPLHPTFTEPSGRVPTTVERPIIEPSQFVFGKSSLIYVADQQRVVMQDSDGTIHDGRRLNGYNHIAKFSREKSLPDSHYRPDTSIALSNDGKHYAVIEAKPSGRNDWNLSISVDGKQVKAIPLKDKVSDLQLSSKRDRLIFVTRSDRSYTVFVDGKPGYEYRDVGALQMSAEGTSYAYVAEQERYKRFVVIDGTEYGPYRDLSTPQFRPIGNNIVWAAKKDRDWRIYLNGQQVDSVPYFRKTKNRLDFIVRTIQKYESYSVGVFGASLSGPTIYKRVLPKVSNVSPDGSRSCYFESTNRYDQFELKLSDQLDRRHGGSTIGGVKALGYKMPDDLMFTPDSKSVLCTVQAIEQGVNETKLRCLSIDGQFAPACFFERSDIPTAMHFPTADQVSFYGLREGVLKKFTVRIDALKTHAASSAMTLETSPMRSLYEIPDSGEGSEFGGIVADKGAVYASFSSANAKRKAWSVIKIDPVNESMKVLADYELEGRLNGAIRLGRADWLYGESSRGIFRVKTNGEQMEYLSSPDSPLATEKSSTRLLGFSLDGSVVVFCDRPNELWKISPDGSKAVNIFSREQPPLGEKGRSYLQSELLDKLYEWALDGNQLYLIGSRKKKYRNGVSLLKVDLGTNEVEILRDFPSDWDLSKLAITKAGKLETLKKRPESRRGPAILTLNADGSDHGITVGVHSDEVHRKHGRGYRFKAPAVRVDGGDWYFLHYDICSELDLRATSIYRQSAKQESIMRVSNVNPERAIVRAFVSSEDGQLYGIADFGEQHGVLFSINPKFRAPAIRELRTKVIPQEDQRPKTVDQFFQL